MFILLAGNVCGVLIATKFGNVPNGTFEKNKKMKRLYYSIFVSAIWTIQRSKFSHDIWQFVSLFMVSVAMFLNIIFAWLVIEGNFLPGFTDFMTINLIDSKYNGYLNFPLYVLVPILVANYYFIFYNQKYLQILDKYPFAKKKSISGIYFLITWFGLGIYFLIFVI